MSEEVNEPMTDLEQAAAAITSASSLALACHISPDGDALGSLLGLHHLCRGNGVASVASWPTPFTYAPHYRFLPGLELAVDPAEFPANPDVMVTFDCGSLARLGELALPAKAARQLVVLDHHATNDRYGSINVVDPSAAATAVVVRDLARVLGWELNRDAALCLYTGLVTDTGRFQYENTTPEVFALAEELASFDLPIVTITRQLFEEHRFAYMQLVGVCLARMDLDAELGFVSTWVSMADLEQYGVHIDETEGLIDLVRRAAEAEVSCVLKETPEGVRVSLRSVSDIDVGELAVHFGGGGHHYAAGFTMARPPHEVVAALRSALREQLGR